MMLVLLFFFFVYFSTLIPKRRCSVFLIPSFLLLFFSFSIHRSHWILIFSGQIGYDCDRPLPNVYSHFVTQLLLTKELVEPACLFFDSEMKYPPDELCVHSSEA